MTNWMPQVTGRIGPQYLAIAAAIAEDVEAGRLPPGTRLPTHRDLAYKLGVTVGTITRAYAEAERRGLISGEVGRGTYIRDRLAATGFLATDPGSNAVDLSLNYPPPTPFEAEALARTMADLAGRPDLLGQLLTYQPHGGMPAHRAAMARWLAGFGVTASPDALLLTTGAQAAMTTIFGAVAKPGEVILADALTYPGMKALASLMQLRLHGLAMDEEGVIPDALEAACRQGGARAYYCLSTLHNPTTATLPEARRRAIVDIARRHDLWLVEDDIHGFLADRTPPPVVSLAPERTLYLTSVSKQMAPGLRIGAIVAPEALLPRLLAVARTTTWMASPVTAEIAARWLDDGTAMQLADIRREETRARQAIVRRRLEGQSYRTTDTSFHVWLALPEAWRQRNLAEEARRRGISVAAGDVFAVTRAAGRDHVRLSISAARSREELDRGLAILAELLAEDPALANAIV